MTATERPWPLLLAAALASLALSAWAVGHNLYINQDGVHYLRAIQGDPQALAWIGHWTFYSRLIGALAALTGLDPLAAAHGLDALFDLVTVVALVELTWRLSGERRVALWAAVLILALPYFNDNRAQIIRDHGYWAFSLLALGAWLRVLEDVRWRPLLAWTLWMGLATLFRVEGAAFLLLMPLSLLGGSAPWPRRWRHLGQAWLPVAALAILVLPWLFQQAPDNRLARLLFDGRELIDQAASRLAATAAGFHALLPDLPRGGGWVLLLVAAVLAILKDLGDALSWPLAATLVLLPSSPPAQAACYRRRLLPAYGAITALVLLAQEARTGVMVSRYTLALALALLPLAALRLDHWWRQRTERPRWQSLLVGLTLLWMAGDSLVNHQAPKPWLDSAGRWAAAHLPPGSRILTDYSPVRLSWYAERFGGRELHFERYRGSATPWQHYDHLFVRHTTSGLAALARRIQARPLARLGNDQRGVTIYRLPRKLKKEQ